MTIYGGVSFTAATEGAKQQHLNASERKRKNGEVEEESQSLLFSDEAEVTESKQLANREKRRVDKARQVLANIPAERNQKLQTVHHRLQEGFYDQQEILESVAEKLLLMFKGEEKVSWISQNRGSEKTK